MQGGSATLSNTGTVASTVFGAVVLKSGGAVGNNGIIVSATHGGIYLNGGSGTNGPATGGALITGVNYGILSAAGGGVTIANYGTIAASGTNGSGVFISGAATITNSGRISGVYGVNIASADTANITLANFGTIVSTNRYAVFFGGSGHDQLVVSPQAVFVGNVFSLPFALAKDELHCRGSDALGERVKTTLMRYRIRATS